MAVGHTPRGSLQITENVLSSSEVLALYDPSLETVVSAVASAGSFAAMTN